MDKQINISLSLEEINAILTTLGELPSKTGVWPLIVKIKSQAEPQANAQPSGDVAT